MNKIDPNKEIINQLRKQNAILADILKELRELNANSKPPVKVTEDDIEEGFIPKLRDNERTRDICHFVQRRTCYTFHKGVCVESRPASSADIYMYRNADRGETA